MSQPSELHTLNACSVSHVSYSLRKLLGRKRRGIPHGNKLLVLHYTTPPRDWHLDVTFCAPTNKFSVTMRDKKETATLFTLLPH